MLFFVKYLLKFLRCHCDHELFAHMHYRPGNECSLCLVCAAFRWRWLWQKAARGT